MDAYDVIRAFLGNEKRRAHAEFELARRDRALLVVRHRANPMAVRPDEIETASRLVERRRTEEAYVASLLAGYPERKTARVAS